MRRDDSTQTALIDVQVKPAGAQIEAPLCPTLELRLFGKLEVRVRGDVVAIGSGKSLRLLALLATAPLCQLSRSALLERLSPSSEFGTSHALTTLVSALNRRFRDALNGMAPVVGMTTGYRLNPAVPMRRDVSLFSAHLESAERYWRRGASERAEHEVEAALSWYLGDLTLDEDVGSLIERERYHELALRGGAWLAEHRLDTGRPRLALDIAEMMLRLDPCNETAHRLVIETLVALGDRSAAVRRFRLCEQILWQELGMRPSHELAAFVVSVCSEGAERPGRQSRPGLRTNLTRF